MLVFVAVNKSDVIRNLLCTVHDMKVKEIITGGMWWSSLDVPRSKITRVHHLIIRAIHAGGINPVLSYCIYG